MSATAVEVTTLASVWRLRLAEALSNGEVRVDLTSTSAVEL
jgi:hypothetical protein